MVDHVVIKYGLVSPGDILMVLKCFFHLSFTHIKWVVNKFIDDLSGSTDQIVNLVEKSSINELGKRIANN